MRNQSVRAEIQKLLVEAPFRPLLITLENRRRQTVGHPENMAFELEENLQSASQSFRVREGSYTVFSTFEAVTSITQED